MSVVSDNMNDGGVTAKLESLRRSRAGKSRFYYSWSHFERFSLNYFEILSDREKVGLILIVSCSLILYFIYFILHFKYLMFLRDGEDTNSKPTDGVV